MKPGPVTFKVSVKDEPPREIQGKAFRGPYGIMLVLHEEIEEDRCFAPWCVTEYTTGRWVMAAESRGEAVKTAINRVKHYGPDIMEKTLAETEKINEP